MTKKMILGKGAKAQNPKRSHRDTEAQSQALAAGDSPFFTAAMHAQEFYRLGREAGQHAIMCGLELIRLQEAHGETRGRKGNKPHAAVFSRETFAERVWQEVGISDDTARRWMQAARAQLPAIMGRISGTDYSECAVEEMVIEIEAWELDSVQGAVAELTQGKTLEQLLLPLDGTGSFDPSRLTGKAKDAWEKIVALCDPYDDEHIGPKLFTPEEHDAWHEDALVMRQRVEAGEIPPARAWAGLRGRAATHGNGRGDVDHYSNLKTALTKLRNSLAKWDELGGEERAEVEAFWQAILPTLPGSWKLTLKKQEGWK